MRGRRAQFKVYLLELKMLTELTANMDGYVFNSDTFKYEQLSGRDAELGRAAYELFARLPYLKFKEFFAKYLGVSMYDVRTSCSIDIFFEGLKSQQFVDYVKATWKDILSFVYMKNSPWDNASQRTLLEAMDCREWQDYVQHLADSVYDCIHKKLIVESRSILGLYSMMPSLQRELIRRLYNTKSFKAVKDRSILLGACERFASFLDDGAVLNDTESDCDTLVISSYIWDQMKYFILKWEREYSSEYTTGNFSFLDENGGRQYFADHAEQHSHKHKRDVDVYETFAKLYRVDNSLAARHKTRTDKKVFRLPYYSVADIVIAAKASRKLAAFEKCYNSMSFPGKCKLHLQDSLLTRVHDTYAARDFELVISRAAEFVKTSVEFQSAKQRNRKLVEELLKKCVGVSTDNFPDWLSQTILDNFPIAKKDSDISVFEGHKPINVGTDTRAVGIFDDFCYDLIADIWDVLGSLEELSNILEGLGTSLAVVWSIYLLKNPTQNVRVIAHCHTAQSLLEYLELCSPFEQYALFDDGIEPYVTMGSELKAEDYGRMLTLLCRGVQKEDRTTIAIDSSVSTTSDAAVPKYSVQAETHRSCLRIIQNLKKLVTAYNSSECLDILTRFCKDVLGIVDVHSDPIFGDASVVLAPQFTEDVVQPRDAAIQTTKYVFDRVAHMTAKQQEEWMNSLMLAVDDMKKVWSWLSCWRNDEYFIAITNKLKGSIDSQQMRSEIAQYLADGVNLESCFSDTAAGSYICLCCIMLYHLVTAGYHTDASVASIKLQPSSDCKVVYGLSIVCVSILSEICHSLNNNLLDNLGMLTAIKSILENTDAEHTYSLSEAYWLNKIGNWYSTLFQTLINPLSRVAVDQSKISVHALFGRLANSCKYYKATSLIEPIGIFTGDVNNQDGLIVVALIRSFLRQCLEALENNILSEFRGISKQTRLLNTYVGDRLNLAKIESLAVIPWDIKQHAIIQDIEDALDSEDYAQAQLVSRAIRNDISVRDCVDLYVAKGTGLVVIGGYYHFADDYTYVSINSSSIEDRMYYITKNDICVWREGNKFKFVPFAYVVNGNDQAFF